MDSPTISNWRRMTADLKVSFGSFQDGLHVNKYDSMYLHLALAFAYSSFALFFSLCCKYFCTPQLLPPISIFDDK